MRTAVLVRRRLDLILRPETNPTHGQQLRLETATGSSACARTNAWDAASFRRVSRNDSFTTPSI